MSVDNDTAKAMLRGVPGRQSTPALRTPLRPVTPDTLPVTAAVVITRGPHAGSRFPLKQPTTAVGRHPRSDVFLDDNTVSRRHVELRAHHTGVQIVDLDSLRGTYLNGAPIDAATELTDGDEIQIGKFHLTFSATKPHPATAHFLNETG